MFFQTDPVLYIFLGFFKAVLSFRLEVQHRVESNPGVAKTTLGVSQFSPKAGGFQVCLKNAYLLDVF